MGLRGLVSAGKSVSERNCIDSPERADPTECSPTNFGASGAVWIRIVMVDSGCKLHSAICRLQVLVGGLAVSAGRNFWFARRTKAAGDLSLQQFVKFGVFESLTLVTVEPFRGFGPVFGRWNVQRDVSRARFFDPNAGEIDGAIF